MDGNKYIILLLDDQFLEKKIKEVLAVYSVYKLLFSLEETSLPIYKDNALVITTLLPSL